MKLPKLVTRWLAAGSMAFITGTTCRDLCFAEAVEFNDSIHANNSPRKSRGSQRIRGAHTLQDTSNHLISQHSLPEDRNNARQLNTKGCVSKLSGDRGGAASVAKCDSPSGGGGTGDGGEPQIATQCTQVTTRHRLIGNGEVSAAHNFGGDILDPPCDRNFFGRGTWWNYIGTGERVVVSTCHPSTNISTALFLYESRELNCANLQCFARSNLNQCGNGGMDAFFASSNAAYYVTILGNNGNNRNIPGPEGSMSISFTRQTNGCGVDVPRLSTRGGMVRATIDESSPLLGPQCNSNLHGLGAWYQFAGIGETVLISTCHNHTNIPTALSVYETNEEASTCSDLTCKQFAYTSQLCLDSDGNSKGSLLKVKSADNRRHYISVVGDTENNGNVYPPGPQGDVGINMIRQFNGCDRDLAPPLLDDGSVVTASNMGSGGAPLIGPQCNENYNGYGRWYQFLGKGEDVIISTCHTSTTVPTVVSVYQSADIDTPCQEATCIVFDESTSCETGGGSLILLPGATKNTIHYLSVLGSNGNVLYPPGPVGDVAISVVTRSNGCEEALPLSDDGVQNIKDSSTAPLLGPQCDMSYNGKGFWYEYTGKGREVLVSTCHPETNVATAISVYKTVNGKCGDELSCVAITSAENCENGSGSSVRFLAEAGVMYKISAVGDNGNLLLPGPEGNIALSIRLDVTCPCWSAEELTTVTPESNGYLEQSCNTFVTDEQATIQLTSHDGLGAGVVTRRGGATGTGCFVAGEINRVSSFQFEDEIAVCLDLLYDRCSTLSSQNLIDSAFAEMCSLMDFFDAIIHSESDTETDYGGCLNITTQAPTSSPTENPTAAPSDIPTAAPSPSPTISCPCWTAAELESATPASLDYIDSSCNTDVSGDLSIPFDPVSRASVRVIDPTGLGARVVRLGATEERVACTMAGTLTRSVISLEPDEAEACLILLHDRCLELVDEGVISPVFANRCTTSDFTDTILLSEDDSDYDNCMRFAVPIPSGLP